MPYPVQQLIEGRGFPVSVLENDTIVHALELMIEYDYSQLPIIDEKGKPLGMITNDSIIKAIMNFGVTIEKLMVTDALVRVSNYYRPEDDLFDLLDRLLNTNAALIIDGEGKLKGIVTSYDSTEYFRRRAEDMMLVEDIESMLKDMIVVAFSDDTGDVIHAKLEEAIRDINNSQRELKAMYGKALSDYLSKQAGNAQPIDQKAFEESFSNFTKNNEPKAFDQLTMNEYIELLLRKESWARLKSIYDFRLEASDLRKPLEGIRDTRNDLAHFRGDISAVQRDQLNFFVDWMVNVQRPIPIEDLTQQKEIQIVVSDTVSVNEDRVIYSFDKKHDLDNAEVLPTDEQMSPRDSRYTPLSDFLNSQPGSVDRITLTFGEIEEIIQSSLPASAHRHRAWWANDATPHRQSNAWLEVGWKTTNINMNEGRVIFARIKERDRAYIQFFSGVLSELRKRREISLRDISPDGASWMIIKGIPEPGPQQAYYGFSFTLHKRFRVELYIDALDQRKTKQIFDNLSSERASFDDQMGTLTWERIDDKRASRIAKYHDGAITDSQKRLNDLKTWAVDTMVKMQLTFTERASEVIRNVMKETQQDIGTDE